MQKWGRVYDAQRIN